MQVAAAVAATARNIDNSEDAKDNESQSVNDTATESINSRPLTADERSFPSTADDSRKTPTLSAWTEQTLKPFDSK